MVVSKLPVNSAPVMLCAPSPFLQPDDACELEAVHVKLETIFTYWLSVEEDQSPDYPDGMNRETVRFWIQDVIELGSSNDRFGFDFSPYRDRIDWKRIEESNNPLDEVAYQEIVGSS